MEHKGSDCRGQQPALVCRNPRKRRTGENFAIGTPEDPMIEKRGRKGQECINSTSSRAVMELIFLESRRRVNKNFRQEVELQDIKQVADTSIRLRKESDWTMWKGRSTPKRNTDYTHSKGQRNKSSTTLGSFNTTKRKRSLIHLEQLAYYEGSAWDQRP
jgi:hypothetical protein